MVRSRLWTRLRALEKKAPKPFQQITILRSVVAPNGPGGIDGPPIYCGIHGRTRTIPGGCIEETFAEPWPQEVPDEMLVSERTRHKRGYGNVIEWFDPPIPESQLPAATVPEAVERYNRRDSYTPRPAPNG